MRKITFLTVADSAGTALQVQAQNAGNTNAFLEKVVATAQKRTQNIQDVPIAITAYTDFDFGLTYDQENTCWGLNSQADYDLTSTLTLSGSLRYSDEETTYRYARTGFETVGFDLLGPSDLDGDYQLDDHWTGSVTLSYTPTQDAMLYGTIARGYKSGGVPGGFPQTPDEHFRFGAAFGYLKTRINSSDLSTFTQEGLEIPYEGLEELDYTPEWSGNLFDEGYLTDAGFDGVGDDYYSYGEARSFGVSLGYNW